MSEWPQIDIGDNGDVDVEEIMRKIKAHIAQRKLVGDDEGSTGPRFQGGFSHVVYDHLFEAIGEKEGAYTTLNVTRSPIPIFGRMLDIVRRKVHELVVFYVNQGATRQVAFNDHLVRAVSALVEELEKVVVDRAEMEELRERVTSSESRLKALENV